MIIESAEQLDSLNHAPLKKREPPKGLIMCTPEGFQVRDVHNYFMEGNIGRVDHAQAYEDWETLRSILERLTQVRVMEGSADCPDIVFAANAALTACFPGKPKLALLSSMVYPSRQAETPLYQAYLQTIGYETRTLPESIFFEGQGDALWHPGAGLLWGGWGKRSEREAYAQVSAIFDVPVIALRLVSELYHLDTCFCPLDAQTALYCPEAFTREGSELIERIFPRAVRVSGEEGKSFVCNAVVVGDTVVVPEGAEFIEGPLAKEGFRAVFVAMHQMKKSGGAMRCCTLDDY